HHDHQRRPLDRRDVSRRSRWLLPADSRGSPGRPRRLRGRAAAHARHRGARGAPPGTKGVAANPMSPRAGVQGSAPGRALPPTAQAAVTGAPGRNGRPRPLARIGLAFNRKPDEGTGSAGAPSANGSAGSQADLYAEWDDEVTIAALETALVEAGEVVRLEA